MVRLVALFAAIAALPVVDLARSAAKHVWSASVSVGEAASMIGIIGLIFVALALIARQLVPNHQSAAVAAVGWFVLVFVYANAFRDLVPDTWTHPWQWILLTLVAVGFGVWAGTRFDPILLTTLVVFLLAAQSAMLLIESRRIYDPPVPPVTATATDLSNAPSVWLILLDSHPSPLALRTYYDIDLAEESSELEGLGFRVWDDARANYSNTFASVPNILSGEVWSPDTLPDFYPSLLGAVHGTTPLVAAFGEAGHTIRMVPANWSRSQCGDLIEECLPVSGFDEHWYFLLRRTPLTDIFPGQLSDPWPAGGLRSVESIATIEPPQGGGKHFTFLHSLASHPPNIIGADCKPTTEAAGSLEDQLRCTHEALLESMTALNLDTDIVIVTSDHGYFRSGVSASPELWTDSIVHDRFSAFTAISTPDGCEDSLSAELSGGQILPLILNCYGAGLPVPAHEFIDLGQVPWGGVTALELDWDGWSVYSAP